MKLALYNNYNKIQIILYIFSLLTTAYSIYASFEASGTKNWTKNSRIFQGHIFHISRTPRTAKLIGIMIDFTCFLLLGVATFLPVAHKAP